MDGFLYVKKDDEIIVSFESEILIFASDGFINLDDFCNKHNLCFEDWLIKTKSCNVLAEIGKVIHPDFKVVYKKGDKPNKMIYAHKYLIIQLAFWKCPLVASKILAIINYYQQLK